MKRINYKFFLLFSLINLSSRFCFATIIIDSVTTVASTCTNNGSATIFAYSTPNPTLLYAIVAGPTVLPVQNSNTFTSLFPGNYTARVYDINFDSTETQFQIGGNYQLPKFSLVGSNPTCTGSSDGGITAIADTAFGLLPFVYEMTSPFVLPQQPSPIFPNLTANTYLIRMTDACGNYQTRTAVLSNTGTGLGYNQYFNVPYLSKIGCDTMVMEYYFYLFKEKSNLPLTLYIATATGTTSKTVYGQVLDTINYTPGYFKIVDTIPNLTYGDYLQVSLVDVCGTQSSSNINQVAPFDFDLYYSPVQVNCVATFTATFQLKAYPQYPFDPTAPMIPISFNLVDVSTNTLVDSGTCGLYCGLTIKPQIAGNFYQLTITDGCGQVWTQLIQWPTAGLPEVNVYNSTGCKDSTAALFFYCLNFQSVVNISILSGPPNAFSTKPGYEYNDTISYPKTYSGIAGSYSFKDCPVGYYTFEVTDSCGNTVQGSFYIEDYMVANFLYDWYVKPSCLNNNTLFFNLQLGTPGAVYASFTDVATGLKVAQRTYPAYGVDSITTMFPGTYALEVYYGNYNGSGNYWNASILDTIGTCWVLHDTITIVPYLNSSFVTSTTIYCNGVNYVELIVDTNKGVPPYQYAIISGPQTFAQQDSGIFQINLFGNYLVSIEDNCGNNYTQQITVSSDSFPPIVKNGFLCAGNNVTLSGVASSYFTYIWQYPNGTNVAGDSISFTPFTIADTSLYHITKIVNINGCNDTLFSTYYLSANDSIPQAFAICQGDTVFVGFSAYYLPGIYKDTLTTSIGCDSILITTITYAPLVTDTNAVTICKGDTITAGNNIYLLPGSYTDTVTTTGNCKKVVVTNISYSYILDSVSATICLGDSVIIGNNIYYQAGTYTDTITTAVGCDSIVALSLSLLPLPVETDSVKICNGDSIIIGSNVYSLPGTYIDTVAQINGCKKILITLLSYSYIIDSNITSICTGGFITIGNSVYSEAGIYTDTLISLSGCDSILITTLTLLPLPGSTQVINICKGDSISIGNNTYSQAGVYTDTITTAGGCKELLLTNLTTTFFEDSISAFICAGDTFQIGSNTYTQAGIYTDTLASAFGCDSVITLNLNVTAAATSLTTALICEGDSFMFGNINYTQAGVFTQAIPTSGCDSIATLQLSVTPLPVVTLTVSADTVQVGDTVLLTAAATQQANYFWSGNAVFSNPNAAANTAVINNSAWIYVLTTNVDGCSSLDSVFINIQKSAGDTCDNATLFIPNVFTPNQDGVNDFFEIMVDDIEVNNVKIFNRWGEQLFETSNVKQSWDGSFKGNKCSAGVYFYSVQYINCVDGSRQKRNGNFSLLY